MADFDEELDASGLNCPLFLHPACQENPGRHGVWQVLHIIATDPGSVKDFEAFAPPDRQRADGIERRRRQSSSS